MKHFLSLQDFTRDEVQALVDHARQLKAAPTNNALAKKIIGLLFMNPSLRTLASFQAGVGQMGGTSVVIQPGAGSWSLEFNDGAVMDGTAVEHIREAIPVLASYCDLLGIRSFARQQCLDDDLRDTDMRRLAALSPKPVINMESASDHPCQALADWMTLDELDVPAHGKFVLSWAWHPKPLPYAVPAAAVRMAAQRGMEVVVHCPPGYDLPEAILAGTGAQVVHDRSTAMAGAHVVYVKSWGHAHYYGDPDRELEMRRGLRNDWCVDEPWYASSQPDAKFMHCLPVRRNVKVTDRLIDGPRSVVRRQAENRMHAQKSVLLNLLETQG